MEKGKRMDGELISAPFSSCCLCKNPGERFRMNTNYLHKDYDLDKPETWSLDSELNYQIACVPCQEDIQEYWQEMWKEYYSSVL